MTDQEYLNRPLLENVTYYITRDLIKITNDHTQFIYASRFTPLDVKAVLNQYDEIRKMLKQHKVKISYQRHLRKTVLEKWDEYRKDCQEAQRLFELMFSTAKEIASRGLHCGTIDDPILKRLNDYQTAYTALFWGNRSITVISEIQKYLEAIPSFLSDSISVDLTVYL